MEGLQRKGLEGKELESEKLERDVRRDVFYAPEVHIMHHTISS